MVDGITSGALVVGDRLPTERHLASELGVSRTTVRHVLQSLTDKGVLEARQGSGWYVGRRVDALANALSLHLHLASISFRHLVEARHHVEPTIAALAAAHRRDDDVYTLRETHLEMARRIGDVSWYGYDLEYHTELATASRNPFFSLAVRPALTALQHFRPEVLHEPVSFRQSNVEHATILDAIERRDAEAARRAMAQHLENWERRIEHLLDLPITHVQRAEARQTPKES